MRQELNIDNKPNLRVMSYNIRTCLGTGSKYDYEQIASKHTINELCKVIKESKAEIVALNEVDRKTFRAQGIDQIGYIAEQMGYFSEYGRNMYHYNGEYGNGLISKYPIIAVRKHVLSKDDGKYIMEPRGMLECQVDVDGCIITVLTVHFGLEFEERRQAISCIEQYLKDAQGTIILMGDFNLDYETEPEEMQPLMNYLMDTAVETGKARELKTFDSLNPIKKIDYIFTSKDVETVHTDIIRTAASDHFPIWADVRLKSK